MSDFPKGGDAEATQAWLDKEGFADVFKRNLWKADALLGKADGFIKSKFPSTDEDQERAEILCGLLQTARELKGYCFFSRSLYSLLILFAFPRFKVLIHHYLFYYYNYNYYYTNKYLYLIIIIDLFLDSRISIYAFHI